METQRNQSQPPKQDTAQDGVQYHCASCGAVNRILGSRVSPGGRRRAARSRPDLGGKQETPPLDGTNDRLLLATVANRPAGGVDPAVQRCVRYGTPVPDTLDQLILADDPVGVLRKVKEQVEDLRLDVNDFAVAAPKLPSVSVEQEFIEL